MSGTITWIPSSKVPPPKDGTIILAHFKDYPIMTGVYWGRYVTNQCGWLLAGYEPELDCYRATMAVSWDDPDYWAEINLPTEEK